MFVKMRQTIATARESYRASVVYDVDDSSAGEWIRKDIAEPSETPPDEIVQLLDRLDDGAGRPCLFLPPAGLEFGHEVMSHMRIVHFHKASSKVVACRPGTEVLYPSASEYVTDWHDPFADADRVGSNRDKPVDWSGIRARFPDHHPIAAGALSPVQEIFPIERHSPIEMFPRRRGLRADVVIGVRRRDYAPQRNWPLANWRMISDAILAAGFTFAVVAAKPTSFDLPGQTCHSGDYDTDAAIELLQGCRLYIGQDSGNSHLAATVGARMLLFRETRTGSRDLTPRMAQVNPSPVERIVAGWNHPDRVAARAVEILRGNE